MLAAVSIGCCANNLNTNSIPCRNLHSSKRRNTRITASSDGTPSPSTSTHRPTEWVSKTVELPGYPRGCHVIHRQLIQNLPEISEFEVGFANFFIQHTSASLTISENASPDVPLDLADALDRLAPEGDLYRHDEEGADDMPAHIKSCLMGASLMLPIAQGRLALGIWQGIYLNEHRNYGGPRKIVVTIQGQKRADGRKYSQYQ
jgi:secondary thiamine-phosphate synthase enzyme